MRDAECAAANSTPEKTHANGPLSIGLKLGYAFGDHAINIHLATVSLFYLFFLSEIVGLSPSLAGLVLLGGRTVDAFTDPLMGRISDRTSWRWGRRRPYFLLAALPFGVSFALLWSTPGVGNETTSFLYYLSIYVASTLCATVLAVPYMALLPELSLDYYERTSINSYRMVGVVVALMLSAVGMPWLVAHFGGGAEGYAGAALVLGAWITFPWLIVYAVSFERKALRNPIESGFFSSLRNLVRHRSYRLLASLFVVARIAVDLTGAMLIFYFSYWVVRPGDFPIAMATMLGCSVASLPFWLALARRVDKSRVFIAGALVWSVMLLAIFSVEPETPRWVVFAYIGVAGVGYSVADLMPWSMLGDVIDEDELVGGERRDGLYVGSFTFLRKLGGASGVALAGVALDFAGFERGGGAQNEIALHAIRILSTLVPLVFLVLACLLAARYGLGVAMHERIRAELDARRTATC